MTYERAAAVAKHALVCGSLREAVQVLEPDVLSLLDDLMLDWRGETPAAA